jgi:hypothetical protein
MQDNSWHEEKGARLMHARCFRMIAYVALVIWACAATYAEAQTRREIRRETAPIPIQSVPGATAAPQATPVPQPVTPAQPAVADPNPSARSERIESRQFERAREGRLIRGRELIGMSIWGSNRERLGTVKDFIVDYGGDCPTLFFAMVPEISGWSDYVIVPFDAFQIGFDERQRTDYFVLGVTLDNLRSAPHLAVDRWNSVHDRQFFTDARQFYGRTERTAARPLSGAGRDIRTPREETPRPPSEGQTAPAPPTTRREPDVRQPSGQREPSAPPPNPSSPAGSRDTGRESGGDGHVKPSSPANPTESAPPKSSSAPAKSEPVPRK